MKLTKHFYVITGLVLMQSYLTHGHPEQQYEQEINISPDEVQPRVETGQLPHPNDDADEDGVVDYDNSKVLPDENDVVIDKRTVDDEDDYKHTGGQTFPNSDETLLPPQRNFYSFDVLDINGELVNLRKFINKISLVVNVASECGFTDGHYKGLVRMQSILGATKKFNILAFPCNQFGAQEPGDNNQIKSFVEERYQVNFPMFSKIRVLDSDIPEAWQYLQEKSGKVPNWNFWKYLVNEDGHVVDAWGPWTSVEDIFDQVQAAVDRISKPKDPVLPHIVTHDGSEL